jgi:hypothetical protein
MIRRIKRLTSLNLPTWTAPVLVVLAGAAAFGLLIPWLGFYWDDWPFIWIRTQLGADGLARYFSTNRPFFGAIVQMTAPLLGAVPWRWHVFILLVRCANAISLWWLLRLVWSRRGQFALWVSLLFLLYPGFDQQAIAINYSTYFIIHTCLFLSLGFTLLAARHPRRFWLYTLPALAFSAISLLASEYFFLLELLRPLLVWFFFRADAIHAEPDSRRTPDTVGRTSLFRRTLFAWLPNLALFLGIGVWRAFFFTYQTHNYQIGILEQMRQQPWQTLTSLAGTVFGDISRVSIGAWVLPFHLPDAVVLGTRTTLLYAMLVIASALGLALWLLLYRRDPQDGQQKTWGWQPMVVGIAGLMIAGWPFWLTSLPVGLHYPQSRFTQPFMLPVSLLLGGLLALVPLKRWMKVILLAAALGMAVGWQFQVGNAYRRDWTLQKTLFWQMSWRMPQLKPGTILVANDTPIDYASDNSLVAPLNWMYAPDNHSEEMSYMFYYPSIRLATGLKNFQAHTPIVQNYLAAGFTGSTDQIVALAFNPPGCLRVLDPDLDPHNGMLPELMRQAAGLSRTDLIVTDATRPVLPIPAILGSEPAHGWCYYFEKADLARQQGDWQTVASLGDQAFSVGDYPNDPAERLVFIEGYAHTGNWSKSLDLSRQSLSITPLMQPMLCRLWQRVDVQTPGSSDKTAALQEMDTTLHCMP